MNKLNQIPHMAMRLSAPVKTLEPLLTQQKADIEAWFNAQWQTLPPPFYCSVDVRRADFKIAPVDTNLFPAGFNNLDAGVAPRCTAALSAVLKQSYPDVSRVLIVPESHTRNLAYYDNLYQLQQHLIQAGIDARVGSLLETLTTAKTLSLPSGHSLTLEPVTRTADQLILPDFTPDLLLLNNDLAAGIPEPLKNVTQPIIPAMNLGWFARLKSAHFQQYQAVTQHFAQRFDFDPWLISPLFRYCGEIDFMTREGEECLIRNARMVFDAVKQKYEQYGVKRDPFLVVKADAGTYGMAVMMIDSPEALTQMNRKQRTRMSATKGGPVRQAIIQEGIYSDEHLSTGNGTAETVVYMVGPHVLGGFYRMHPERSEKESLNTPGMCFEPIPIAASEQEPDYFYLCSVIARLAALASAKEG